MSEIFTGNNFVVNTEIAPAGEGVCPLFDALGERLGDMKDLIRINSEIGGDWPESFVDQGNGSYFRVSNNGVGYGTSVVGCPGFKTLAKFHFIPAPRQIEFSGDPESFCIKATGAFEERDLETAKVVSERIWHRPPEGRGDVKVELSTSFEMLERMPLSTATNDVGKDLFRWYMLSSMYVNDITYDSNLLQFEDAEGNKQEISISKAYEVNNGKRRDGHLFEKPVPLGSWLELVKTTGSTWLPRSPSIRYDIRDTHGMQLGVQGWWSGSDNPDDDNLNIWLEWIDVPKALEPDMQFQLDVGVTSMSCVERDVEKSLPAWPKRLWWKPKDYSHRMEYDYALDK
jgi:hypothetical protein